MKIAIYNPYLKVWGGGEKYVFSLAEFILKRGHEVCFLVKEPEWKTCEFADLIQKKTGLDLTGVTVMPLTEAYYHRLLKFFSIDALSLSAYDAVIYLVNGLPPVSFHRKNITIVQFPAMWTLPLSVSRESWNIYWRWIFLKHHRHLVVYSQYILGWVKKCWERSANVISPPINAKPKGEIEKKENIILSVGRFFKGQHNKKHLDMIKIFKKIHPVAPEWRLVLAGRFSSGDHEYLQSVHDAANGYPIEIKTDISENELEDLYKKSKIYWHATGWDENSEEGPEKFEHFGMTTAEAMTHGCVPVVVGRGGQADIVQHEKNGFLWETEEEWFLYTKKVIDDPYLWNSLSEAAVIKSQDFEKNIFMNKFENLFREAGISL